MFIVFYLQLNNRFFFCQLKYLNMITYGKELLNLKVTASVSTEKSLLYHKVHHELNWFCTD